MADEKRYIGDIVVDFDGTVVKMCYPEIGPPEPYAREVLQVFRDMGYRIVISSCRTSAWYPEDYGLTPNDVDTPEKRMARKVFQDMKAYLDMNMIPYDILDDGGKGKPSGMFYIDDKGVRYDGDWRAVGEFVLRHTPGIITKLGLGDTNK